MLAGRKPLAVFSSGILSNEDETLNSEFDASVRDGLIVKHVQEQRWPQPYEQGGRLILGTRRTLFALKEESWRIPAYLLLREATEDLPWSDALESVACRLLGYTKEEANVWIAHINERYGGWGAIPVFVALTDVDVKKVEALGYRALPPDFSGPNFLVIQEQCPDFLRLCPDFRDVGLRPARLALTSKFAVHLNVETVEEIRLVRFDPGFVKQINQNLRRNIDMLDIT